MALSKKTQKILNKYLAYKEKEKSKVSMYSQENALEKLRKKLPDGGLGTQLFSGIIILISFPFILFIDVMRTSCLQLKSIPQEARADYLTRHVDELNKWFEESGIEVKKPEPGYRFVFKP